MNRCLKIGMIVTSLSAIAVPTGLILLTRRQTLNVIRHPPEKRPPMLKSPEDFGMICEDVKVSTEDGLTLHGWYISGKNGATIMVQHGSPGGRQDGLFESEFLHRHGYNVLPGIFRAHDESEGDLINYGYHEVKDIAAWHQYLLNHDDLNPDKIGLFGESMGGETSILYTAWEEGIKVLVIASAPAITQGTIKSFIEYETGLPG